MLADSLNSRVALFGKVDGVNDLGQLTGDYHLLRYIYAEIIPTGGVQQNGAGNTVYAEVSHKLTVRAASVPEFTNDMYFTFRGQRYDVKYYMPNYKLRDRVEIFCSLVVE